MCFAQLVAGMATVDEDMARPRIETTVGCEDRRPAIAILDAGRMHDEAERIARGVGDDMAFVYLDLPARVIAARTTTSVARSFDDSRFLGQRRMDSLSILHIRQAALRHLTRHYPHVINSPCVKRKFSHDRPDVSRCRNSDVPRAGCSQCDQSRRRLGLQGKWRYSTRIAEYFR